MMDDIAESQDLSKEISEAISNPVALGLDVDEVRLITHFLIFKLTLLIVLILLHFSSLYYAILSIQISYLIYLTYIFNYIMLFVMGYSKHLLF